MNYYHLVGVFLTFIHIIYGKSLDNFNPPDDSIPVEERGLIEVMIQKLGMQNFDKVNIRQIYTTLDYCLHRIEIITELIVNQKQTSATENLLTLLSTIHDVFDAIGETTNSLENSLNGIVECIDFAVLDMQIALQVLVEAFISNCDLILEMETQSDGAIPSAVYCLSSSIKMLLMSMSELMDKIEASTETIDVNVTAGLNAIVQTILNITDRVIQSLKSVHILEGDAVDPSLEQLSMVVQQLLNQRLNLVPKMSRTIVLPVSEVSDSLKLRVDQLPLMTEKSIETLVDSLTNFQDIVADKNIIPNIVLLLNALQPNLTSLSKSIHSIHGINESVAYTTDVSVYNLIATIKCLTYYITVFTKILPMDERHIEKDLQSIVSFIASNIQTMIDGITIVLERALVDLICSRPTEKKLMDTQLTGLQTLLEPVILSFENVVRTSIHIVENLMNLGVRTMSGIGSDITYDMNLLISSLKHIANGEIFLTSSMDNIVHSSVIRENVLSVCIKAFDKVAENLVELGVHYNDSIYQIRRYLVEM